jgi:hypothetical protein
MGKIREPVKVWRRRWAGPSFLHDWVPLGA